VWRLVVPLARRRIAPNAVTGVAIACGFAAISFFAAGLWGPGLALAYATSVLDAVDGKLARLTLTASRQGAALDHALDVVHPPLWYGAWAWGLSGGDAGSTLFHASLWMAGLFVVDRLLANLFESCTGGRSPRRLEPLGGRLRSLGSRRNVNLALFTAGLALGHGTEAFYAVGALQLAAVLHHLGQVVRVWNVDPGPEAPHAPRLQPLGPPLDALGGPDS
jgi:hypothetical protein